MTPVERVETAAREFRSWTAPAYMDAFQREYSFGDRRGTALARLLGRLEALLDTGTLSPESLADVVELALQVPDEDLVFGRKPVPEVRASVAVAQPRPIGWLLDDEVHYTALSAGGLG